MKTGGIAWGFAALLLSAASVMGTAQAAPAQAPEGLPLPPAVEKELAAKATDVTEVTLGKNMLEFASKFMKGKDPEDEQARKLIQGLKGVYVREYEFEKEGEYSLDQLQQLRAYFETSEWSPVVRERERKRGEVTDVLMKVVNGETQGMFILSAEPKELTIVLILGPIRMEDLGELGGIGGLGALGSLGGVQHAPHGKKGDTE
jgi:Domain of unknown function (DUF4252)